MLQLLRINIRIQLNFYYYNKLSKIMRFFNPSKLASDAVQSFFLSFERR